MMLGCALLALAQESSDIRDAVLLAHAALGLTVIETKRTRDESRAAYGPLHGFHFFIDVPGFGRRGGIQRTDLDGSEGAAILCRLNALPEASTRPHNSCCRGISAPSPDWVRRLPEAPITVQPGVLRLSPLGQGSPVAVGSVTVSPSATTDESVVISQVLSGCAMQHGFEFPVLVEQSTVLDFSWDLHNPVNPSVSAIHLEVGGVWVRSIPMQLDGERIVAVSPSHVDTSGTSDSATIRIACVGRRIHEVRVLGFPPCISKIDANLVGLEAALGTHGNDIGRFRHSCGSIRGVVRIGGDSQPFGFQVSVRHDPSVKYDAERPLRILVQRGEEVSFFLNAQNQLRLVYSNRGFGCEGLLALNGYDRVASVIAEGQNGQTEFELRQANEQITVEWEAKEHLNHFGRSWMHHGVRP